MQTHQRHNDPYPECENCKDLGDCPHPEVDDNLMGTPMPSDVCPKPIDVMKETLKKRKYERLIP